MEDQPLSHAKIDLAMLCNMGGAGKEDEACKYLKISFTSSCKVIFLFYGFISQKNYNYILWVGRLIFIEAYLGERMLTFAHIL